jgi:hypothetical protein
MGFLSSSIGRVDAARGLCRLVAFTARFDLNLTAIGEHNSPDPHNLPCLFSSFGVKGGEIRDRFPSNTDFHQIPE